MDLIYNRLRPVAELRVIDSQTNAPAAFSKIISVSVFTSSLMSLDTPSLMRLLKSVIRERWSA